VKIVNLLATSPESCWVISTLLFGAGGPYRMRPNHNPEVGHKVRSKPGWFAFVLLACAVVCFSRREPDLKAVR
jgi:hypothetical protein